MAHFAEINKNNVVINVVVAEQDFINSGALGDSFDFIQTSYNGNFRNKYATIGDTWDASRNAFLSPQPYPSWLLNEESLMWEAPSSHDNEPCEGNVYIWSEATGSWVVESEFEHTPE